MKNSSGGLFVNFHGEFREIGTKCRFMLGYLIALVRLSGWEEIKMKCSERVNEMSGLAAGGGGGGGVG